MAYRKSALNGRDCQAEDNTMARLKSFIVRLVREEQGQDLIEYALLAALLAVAAVVILKPLATAVIAVFQSVIDAFAGV